jgi:hypothetical protein
MPFPGRFIPSKPFPAQSPQICLPSQTAISDGAGLSSRYLAFSNKKARPLTRPGFFILLFAAA